MKVHGKKRTKNIARVAAALAIAAGATALVRAQGIDVLVIDTVGFHATFAGHGPVVSPVLEQHVNPRPGVFWRNPFVFLDNHGRPGAQLNADVLNLNAGLRHAMGPHGEGVNPSGLTYNQVFISNQYDAGIENLLGLARSFVHVEHWDDLYGGASAEVIGRADTRLDFNKYLVMNVGFHRVPLGGPGISRWRWEPAGGTGGGLCPGVTPPRPATLGCPLGVGVITLDGLSMLHAVVGLLENTSPQVLGAEIRMGAPNGQPLMSLQAIGNAQPFGAGGMALAVTDHVVNPQLSQLLQQGVPVFLSVNTPTYSFAGPLRRLTCAQPASNVTAAQLGPGFSPDPRRYWAPFIVVNASAQTLVEPVAIAFRNLTPNVSVANADGHLTPECAPPGRDPYLLVNAGLDGALAPGERRVVIAEFARPRGQAVNFAVQVLTGGDLF